MNSTELIRLAMKSTIVSLKNENSLQKVENLNEGYAVHLPKNKVSWAGGWARNYLKRAGLIEKDGLGVWTLTQKGRNFDESPQNILDVQREVLRTCRRILKKKKAKIKVKKNGNEKSHGNEKVFFLLEMNEQGIINDKACLAAIRKILR